MPRKTKQKTGSSANLGFEATLWAAADKLRNNMDAAEYKHVVLGLIFLKYISDAFEERRPEIVIMFWWASIPIALIGAWWISNSDVEHEMAEVRVQTVTTVCTPDTEVKGFNSAQGSLT